jgi:branched-subunit amino acid ABC-type transport system permease component
MNFFLTIVVDGLIQASWLFIVALGLTLVFGVLKILNIAHGSLYALGAYVAATSVTMAAARSLRLCRNAAFGGADCLSSRPDARARPAEDVLWPR